MSAISTALNCLCRESFAWNLFRDLAIGTHPVVFRKLFQTERQW